MGTARLVIEEIKLNGAARMGRPVLLRVNERLDDLERNGMRIIQRTDAFRFGTDSVLLADFAAPKPRDKVADLGAGSGVLCLLMADKEQSAAFDAIELQADIADMAARSVRLNGLADRITVRAMDLKNAPKILGHGTFSLVVANPPYSPSAGATLSARAAERVARHEVACELRDVSECASRLLKNGGRFALVFPARRALEMMNALEENHLSPKRVRMIQLSASSAPKLMLLCAVKGGGPSLHWMPPLILREEDGSESREWKRIYRKRADAT